MRRKSKAILAAAVATVFATAAAGALVACNNNDEVGVYEITFNANGGGFSSADPVTMTTIEGHLTALPTETPTRVDYTFNGWNLESDGSGETVSITTNFEATTTVYAQWKKTEQQTPVVPTELTIKFDANGGELVGGGTSTTKTATNGKISGGLPQVEERTGYTFGGWFANQEGTGTPVTSNYTFTSAITVYAKWTLVGGPIVVDPVGVYDITFNANGGTLVGGGTTATLQTANGVLTEALPQVAQRDGYGFTGWNTRANGSGDTVTASTSFSADTPVYAQWLEDITDVPQGTLKVNGGAAQSLTYNRTSGDAYADKEYMLTGLTLSAGDALTFALDGEPLTFNMDERCHGVTRVLGALTSLSAKVDGTFDIYLRHYEASGEKPACWTVEMNDGVVEAKDKYYLVGDINGYGVETAYMLETSVLNADDKKSITAQYQILGVTFPAESSFTIRFYGTTKDEYYGAEFLEEWVDSSLVTGGGGQFESDLKTVAGGTYDIYLKFYKDGTTGIYVGEAGGELPDIPDKVVKINGTEMTDNTDQIPSTAVTQKLEYQSTLTLANNATVSFTVDNQTIQVWVESAPNVAITGVGSRTTSFKTKKAGAFTFTLKYYTDGGANGTGGWNVYVVGPTEDIGEEPDLVPGEYYLVGGKYGFEQVSGYWKLDDNGSLEVEISEGQEFKIVQCGTNGKPVWTEANYGYGAVTTGKGYVTSNKDGNMVFKISGTYTITLNSSNKIEITSDEVTEPVVTGPTVGGISDSGIWLVGEGLTGGGWNDGVELEEKNGYSVTINVSTGWLKIRVEGSSDGNGTNALADTTYAKTDGTNFVVRTAGKYKFTWNKTTNKLTVEPAPAEEE